MITEKQADKIKQFIQQQGDYALDSWHRLETTTKEDQVDVVTQVDTTIETNFHEFVHEHFPEHGFIGEEHENFKNKQEFTWLIDPIDGTKYYANEVPLWSITVSLLHRDEPVFGLVYDPVASHMFEATADGPALLNGHQIHVKEVTDLSKLELVTIFSPKPDYKEDLIDMMGDLMEEFYRVRILGTAALSLCYLANGHFGAYLGPYTAPEKEVDISAGLLIAQQAGAHIEYIEADKGYEHILVAGQHVIDDLSDIVVGTH